MTAVDDVRRRVQLALSGGAACPKCGHQEWPARTARELSRLSGVKPGVIRRFVKGGDILASNLDRLDAHTMFVAEPWPDLPYPTPQEPAGE